MVGIKRFEQTQRGFGRFDLADLEVGKRDTGVDCRLLSIGCPELKITRFSTWRINKPHPHHLPRFSIDELKPAPLTICLSFRTKGLFWAAGGSVNQSCYPKSFAIFPVDCEGTNGHKVNRGG